MSTGKKTPLSSAASAWPRSAFISKIATSTPTDASFRLVASPNPDAPPVTTAAIPDPNFMQALLPDGMLPPRSLPMAHPGKDRHGGGCQHKTIRDKNSGRERPKSSISTGSARTHRAQALAKIHLECDAVGRRSRGIAHNNIQIGSATCRERVCQYV